MARIILINPYPEYAKGINQVIISPPLGLAYLAAVLEKNGHKVQIIDANILRIKSKNITAHFAFKPNLIGISVNIVTYKAAIECARKTKAIYERTPVIFGGPYSSSLAQKILEKIAAVDAIVIGEGENTLAEIAESLERKNIFENIKGIVYKFQGQIIFNTPRPLINDIDDIPFPAYHLLPDLRNYKTRSRGFPVGSIITSRGCPFQCTFCNRNIFGNLWRPHSVNRIVEEICYLIKDYNIRQIDILDDNFTYDKYRAWQILDGLVRNCPKIYINLQNGVRVDRIDQDLLVKMKEAGVFRIALGIETANQDIQKRIKKPVDLQKAMAIVNIARSLGIITVGFFMIGLPAENVENMKQTVEYSLRMNPHLSNFSICIPFPGSELFEEIKKSGRFFENIEEGISAGFYGKKSFFTFDSIESQQISSYFLEAYRRFYLRPSKIIDVILTIRSIGEIKWLIKILFETFKIKLTEFN